MEMENKKQTYCTAIVLAAGQGKRMGGNVLKQFLELKGRPVICHCLQAFEDSDKIDEVILVAGEGKNEYCKKEIVEKYGFRKVMAIVEGGKERYHSVWNALQKAGESDHGAEEEYIFIHDGARPFLDVEMIDRGYECVRRDKACVFAMPVKDTIKLADGNDYVCDTPNRAYLWQIQTPQIFEKTLIMQAYKSIMEYEDETITDDAMVVEKTTGRKVRLIKGSYENIKITTPEDLPIAEIFAEKRK